MRRFALPFGALLLLAGCGRDARSNAASSRDPGAPPTNAAPTVDRGNVAAPAPSVNAIAPAEPPEIPGLAEMSPYRRREYERGFRDCRAGSFDPARQGESYRIGCMAAQEASDRSE